MRLTLASTEKFRTDLPISLSILNLKSRPDDRRTYEGFMMSSRIDELIILYSKVMRVSNADFGRVILQIAV